MMNFKKCSGVRSTILQLLLAVSLLQLGSDPDSNPVRVNRRSDQVRSVRMGVQSAFTHAQSLTPPLFIHPKSVDAFDANPVFAELHELGIPSLLRRIRTRVFAYLAEDPGPPPTRASNEAAAGSESEQRADCPSEASSPSTANLTQEVTFERKQWLVSLFLCRQLQLLQWHTLAGCFGLNGHSVATLHHPVNSGVYEEHVRKEK
ncbi:hypothetical protein HPB48_004696 [Haemaphysalis longicornis]|uniref:Secreted protein n=1 Tax=Haemaphysalis longicornis TaxID=44386 RepID=A0A9J6G0C4_HAELO|nr:hypothetical protein HPB48_004696 [Haemaphysalis longicornis]